MEGSSYVLVDIYENLWSAPEVFLKWREAVDSGAMKDPEKSACHYSITHIRDEFQLYCFPKKDTFQAVKHPAPAPYSPLPKASEADNDDGNDEEEAFPADGDKSNSDFKPDKK